MKGTLDLVEYTVNGFNSQIHQDAGGQGRRHWTSSATG
ncbi:hypothetical protein GZL_02527 [Streptomyces sp. 769]|nr:hypothetical protein GZL_02527 [Streptomyces sp. 769]